MKRYSGHRVFMLLTAAVLCLGTVHAEWPILRWIEKPQKHGPSTKAKPEDRTKFIMMIAYDRRLGRSNKTWRRYRGRLREGDVIAYRMKKWDARKEIIKGNLNALGYRMLKYGHLGIITRAPGNSKQLVMFSSVSLKGPNVNETIDSLRTHDWDCYRLDQWDRVDRRRMREFITQARANGENWRGYDFTGMLGLWNSELKPDSKKKVGNDYICSTIVVAALYYSGIELDAVNRNGIGDVVTPAQVVRSRGRVIPVPEGELKVGKVKAGKVKEKEKAAEKKKPENKKHVNKKTENKKADKHEAEKKKL